MTPPAPNSAIRLTARPIAEVFPSLFAGTDIIARVYIQAPALSLYIGEVAYVGADVLESFARGAWDPRQLAANLRQGIYSAAHGACFLAAERAGECLARVGV